MVKTHVESKLIKGGEDDMYKITLTEDILFYPDPEYVGNDKRTRILYKEGESFTFHQDYKERLAPYGKVTKVRVKKGE